MFEPGLLVLALEVFDQFAHLCVRERGGQLDVSGRQLREQAAAVHFGLVHDGVQGWAVEAGRHRLRELAQPGVRAAELVAAVPVQVSFERARQLQ